MLLTRSKKTACCFGFALVAVLMTAFFSCQKELHPESTVLAVAPPDFTTKVSSSISGFITDENDLSVADAVVSTGNSITVSDKYGFFEIKNVQVVKDAAIVKVEYPGYFKGIKTYLTIEGKSVFFRVKLIPKINAGDIDATSGGHVTFLQTG